MTKARGPFGLMLRRCLWLATLPTLLATLLAWWLAPRSEGEPLDAAAAAEPWVALPLLCATAICTLATAGFWPMFAQGRPGADMVRRLHPRRLQGGGRAIAAALVAQALLTTAVLLPLLPAIGAPAKANAQVTATADRDVLLPGDGSVGELAFTVPAGRTYRAVTIRPLAGAPADGLVPTRLHLHGDDGALSEHEIAVDDSLQVFQLRFAPRPLRHFRLVRNGGTVPLLFPPGSITVQLDAAHPTWANALLLVLVLLLPSWLALGLGCLCGRAAALPTTATVVAALLFVATVGELGPAASALRRVLRGEWLLGESLFASLTGGGVLLTGLPLLLVGCAAMFVASRVQPWRRR